MPLSMPEIEKGAQVAVAVDERGKKLAVARKGVIVKVCSFEGTEVDADGKVVRMKTVDGNNGNGIAEIWVQFSKTGEPELVKNYSLAIVKQYDKVARESMRLREKNAEAQARSEGEILGDMNEPVIMLDETEVDSRKPLGGEDVEVQFPTKKPKK